MDTAARATSTPGGRVTPRPRRALLDMQRRAYRRDGPPPAAQRLAALKALDACCATTAIAMAAAISADFGHRAHEETTLAELVPRLAAIRHARRNLRRWMRPERRRVDISFQPGRAWVEWQPLGCVAIMAPWNYPLLLTVSPLVDALAAGNRVIVKPSELAPRFSALFARLLAEAIDPAQRQRRHRRPGRGAGAVRAAAGPPAVHRLHRRRPPGRPRRGGER